MHEISKYSIICLTNSPLTKKLLSENLNHPNRIIYFYDNTVACLDALKHDSLEILIFDSSTLKHQDALDFINQANQIHPWLPIIVVAEKESVHEAVEIIKAGAFDLIEKPVKKDVLLPIINRAIKNCRQKIESLNIHLTNAEIHVLELLLQGQSNKQIASTLNRSVRTIEDHRAHIMHKLQVGNPIELTRKAFQMGLLEKP